MKEIGLITIVMAFCVVSLVRCFSAAETADAVEYVQWIEHTDNGLHRIKAFDGYVFDVQYKPAEYVVLKENSEMMPEVQTEMEKQVAGLSDMQYCTFRISREDGADLLAADVGSTEEYSSRLAYFTSTMQQDLSLIEGKDTLPCLLFHFERTYGVDVRSTFLLGFARSAGQTPADRTFVFEDRELGVGPVLLTITAESIRNVPSLKLK